MRGDSETHKLKSGRLRYLSTCRANHQERRDERVNKCCIGLTGHDRRLSLSLISTTWSASCSRCVCALCAFEIAGGFARESILTVRHPRMCLTAPSDPARQQFLP